MNDRKKQWFQLYLIVILAFAAFIIAFPRIPIQLNIAGKEYHQELAGPDIDFTLFGKDFYKELNFGYGLYLGGGSKWTFDVDLELIQEEEKLAVFKSVQKQFEERMVVFGLDDVELTANEETYQISLSFVEDQVEIQDLILVYREGSVEFAELKEEYRESDDETVLSDPLSYGETELDDSELLGASVLTSPTTGEPLIQLHMSDAGKQLFYDISKRNEGLPVAILLDGQIIAAPRISSELTEDSIGDPVLSGGYTEETAELLEKVFDAGPLSAPVNFSGLEEIDPIISSDTIKNFAIVGVAGMFVVFAALFAYYGVLGGLVIPSSFIFILLFLAIFKLGIPSVLVWAFGEEMPETIFTTIPLTVGGVIGLLLSFTIILSFKMMFIGEMKERQNGKPLDIETINSVFDNSSQAAKRLLFFVVTASLVMGLLGSSMLRYLSISCTLGVTIGLFTIYVVLKNFITIFAVRANKR